ncbi:MAG: MFS transporter [Alphaproteobacteria bacterium]
MERRALTFTYLGHYLHHLFMLLYATVVLALEREFHRPYGELLALSLPAFVLSGVGALPAGWLGDRFGERKMLTVYFLGIGASAIGAGLAPSPFWIAVALGVMGLFASIYHPVGFGWLVRHASRRGRALGINAVFGSAGTASAALVAGALIDLVDWRAAFIVPGAATLVIALLFLALIPAEAPNAARREAGSARPTARAMLGSTRLFAALCVILMGGSVIYNALTVGMPKLFAERLGDGGELVDVASLVTLVYAVAAGAQLLGGYLADRAPHRIVLVVAYGALVPVLLLTTSAMGTPLVVAAVAILSLVMAVQPAVDSLIAHHAPPEWRSTAYGLRFVVSLSSSAASVPLVGFIFDSTGSFTWVFFTLVGFAALVLVACVLLPSVRAAPAGARSQPSAAE